MNELMIHVDCDTHLQKAISGRGFPKFNVHALHVSGKFSCGAMIQQDYLRGKLHYHRLVLRAKVIYSTRRRT